MKISVLIKTLFCFILVFLSYDCSDKNEDFYSNNHGGTIAYCYQPLQNGLYQIYIINEDGTGNKKMVESSTGLNHLDW